jgi:hypothetical protein
MPSTDFVRILTVLSFFGPFVAFGQKDVKFLLLAETGAQVNYFTKLKRVKLY